MATALNPRQLKFVEEYLRTGIATQAYIAAGYKARGHAAETSASELLRNPEVKRLIDEACRKAAVSQEVSAAWVFARLKVEAEREGEDANHAARVKAIELAAKLLGMLTDKVDVTTGGKPVEANSVSVAVSMPARAAVVEYLRDIGLPCPGDVPADGGGEPVGRGDGL